MIYGHKLVKSIFSTTVFPELPLIILIEIILFHLSIIVYTIVVAFFAIYNKLITKKYIKILYVTNSIRFYPQLQQHQRIFLSLFKPESHPEKFNQKLSCC